MTMMKRHWGPVVLSLTALLLLCNNVTADTTYDGDPALISIDIEKNGEYSSESILFSESLKMMNNLQMFLGVVPKDGAEFDGGDLLNLWLKLPLLVVGNNGLGP